MSNTHAIADTAYELQATCEDLLPACVISTTWPTVPVSSMTLAAFATQAYVRDGQALIYCDQPAITLPLSGSAGTYWLAISRDLSTAYATWTRRAGSHYLWQLAGSRPPDVDGLLVFASVTVAGGVITAVTPAPGVTRAERWRTLAALGTMATQNANAVAITGGSAVFTAPVVATGFQVNNQPADNTLAFYGLQNAGGTNRWNLFCPGSAPNALLGPLVLGATTLLGTARQSIWYRHADTSGILFQPLDGDTGPASVLGFFNLGGGLIGNIATTGTTTAYNTASDARLKHAVAPLTGALDVVRRLRPITHLWNADGSRGYGFLAHELQQAIPDGGIVTGEADAVGPQGEIVPQQVDHSKLVPWLTAMCQELDAQVEALLARVTSLETQLGV